MNKNMWVTVIVILVVVFAFSFWYSGKKYNQGYQAAIADIKAQQEELAKQATKAAVDQANPFKVQNPLQGVQANPFEKAKKTLNPFN